MNYLTISIIACVGLLLWLVSTISIMKDDIKRINTTLNKIAEKVGINDTITIEIKKLLLEKKEIEAIKKYRLATGASLIEAKEYIDSLIK